MCPDWRGVSVGSGTKTRDAWNRIGPCVPWKPPDIDPIRHPRVVFRVGRTTPEDPARSRAIPLCTGYQHVWSASAEGAQPLGVEPRLSPGVPPVVGRVGRHVAAGAAIAGRSARVAWARVAAHRRAVSGPRLAGTVKLTKTRSNLPQSIALSSELEPNMLGYRFKGSTSNLTVNVGTASLHRRRPRAGAAPHPAPAPRGRRAGRLHRADSGDDRGRLRRVVPDGPPGAAARDRARLCPRRWPPSPGTPSPIFFKFFSPGLSGSLLPYVFGY